MRALFTTTGHAGHLIPLIPYARALLAAGHDVLFAAPHSRGAAVEAAGFEWLPFDDAPESEAGPVWAATLGASVDEANRLVIGDVYGRINTRAALPGVLEAIDSWRPDVVVRECYEFAGYLAAELRDVPHLRVATGLAGMEEVILSLAGEDVSLLGEELGLAPDPDAWRIRASAYLSSTPPGLDDGAPPGTRRFREVGMGPGANGTARNGSARPLPDWWRGGSDPLVYMSFGSVAGALGLFPKLYRDAIDALAGLPVRLLVTTGEAGDPAELGPLPANTHRERWVPQAGVMPAAAAMVGHGGYGSTVGAMAAGVPMVVMPMFADQPHNARRVAEIGAGIALMPDAGRASLGALMEAGPGTFGALPGAVLDVLREPGYRRAARRVADGTHRLAPVEAATEEIASWASGRTALAGALTRP